MRLWGNSHLHHHRDPERTLCEIMTVSLQSTVEAPRYWRCQTQEIFAKETIIQGMDKLRRKKYVIGSTDGRAETSKPFDSGLGTRVYSLEDMVFTLLCLGLALVQYFLTVLLCLHCTP